MKQLFFLFALTASASSLFGQNKKPFTLNGTITGRDTGKIYFSYSDEGIVHRDSALIKNGKFVFTGYISEPAFATLSEKQHFSIDYKYHFDGFYIDTSRMNVSLQQENFKDAKLTGSRANAEYSILNALMNPLFDSVNHYKRKLYNATIDNSQDSASLKYYQALAKNGLINFTKEHPNSIVSIFPLLRMNQFGISEDSIFSLFNLYSDKVKSGSTYKTARGYILDKINSETGRPAPSFTRTDINGNILNLSDFKGKYVLLDYWASWCAPCRAYTPHIKELYNKYHSKGLDVIAISCDMKYDDWQKAFRKDSMQMFYNILSFTKSDMEFLKNKPHSEMLDASMKGELRVLYNLTPIPADILIDKNGIIIGRYAPDDSPREDLDKKLKEIFRE